MCTRSLRCPHTTLSRSFTISGTHTYAAAGSSTITVTISHEGVMTTGTSTATVAQAGTAPTVTAPGNKSALQGARQTSFTLAMFAESRTRHWLLTVDWGD